MCRRQMTQTAVTGRGIGSTALALGTVGISPADAYHLHNEPGALQGTQVYSR